MDRRTVTLRLARLHPERDADLPLPQPMTASAAGMDVVAALSEPLQLGPGERAAVPTGLACAVPPGWEIQVRPRSGLALRHGVTVANAPGTIDADYRGELKVLLVNHGQDSFLLERGMRVAQLVVAPVPLVTVLHCSVAELGETERGDRGFGSTGLR